jgi:hypothetical protein
LAAATIVMVAPGGGGGGGAGATCNVKVIRCGLFDATDDATGIAAAYVPGAKPAVDAVSLSLAGASVPLSSVCSHPAAPPPYAIVRTTSPVSGAEPAGAVMATSWGGRGAAPSVSGSVMLDGVNTMDGAGAGGGAGGGGSNGSDGGLSLQAPAQLAATTHNSKPHCSAARFQVTGIATHPALSGVSYPSMGENHRRAPGSSFRACCGREIPLDRNPWRRRTI